MKRFHGVSFLAGFALMGLFAGIALDLIDSGWQRTIESHKKLERTLMDRIELRDQQDMALRSSVQADAQVKTILIEDAHAGALRAAWTVPGRVVPHTDDGRAGAYYGYLDATGHIDGWRSASRDEAPNVLDVTLSGPFPGPPSDLGTPPCPAGGFAVPPQQLIDILKAARGAR